MTERNYRNDCLFCGKPLVPLERGIWTKKYGYLDGYWEHKDEDYDKCPEVIRENQISNRKPEPEK